MFQEFPKCLIQGERSRVVFSEAEELTARAEGFTFHSDNAPQAAPAVPKNKPGRKPKAE